MSEAKPTLGEWEAWTGAAKFGITGPAAAASMVATAAIRQSGFGHFVDLASSSQECPGIALGDTKERAIANARLIAEAGTVHHETGLTPRQLVGRVKELEGVLQSARDYSSDSWSEWLLSEVDDALSKSLPNTVAETPSGQAQPAAPQGGERAVPETLGVYCGIASDDVTDPTHPRYVAGFKAGHAAGKKRASHEQAPAVATIARVVLGTDGTPASDVHLVAEGDKLDVDVFDATYPQRAPHRIANLVEQPTAQQTQAAQGDAARLDFLESHPEMSLRHRKGQWALKGFTNYEYDMHPSLRAAIDAERAALAQKEQSP